jgi:hypothetical protein
MDKKQTVAKQVEFYELEKAKFIIKDACGLDIAYAYEDLVFSEHGVFILQFADTTSNNMYCWFNAECIENERISVFESLTRTGKLNKTKIEYKGQFEMTQKDGEEQIDIRFIELKKA